MIGGLMVDTVLETVVVGGDVLRRGMRYYDRE